MNLSRLGAAAAIAALTAAACGSGGSSSADRPRRTTSTMAASTSTMAASTTTTLSPTTTTTTAPEPQFRFAVAPIEGAVRARVVGSSWRAGCPVPLEQLRYLSLSYWGFDGAPHTGELIVHADEVDAMNGAFNRLFAGRFPIRSLRLVDDFGADDYTSIEADNTSAFNCRAVTGGTGWSQHAYGRAIDVNPIENPYVSNGGTDHAASGPYLDRASGRPGMAVGGGLLVQAFAAVGWGWGGTWSSPTDYQHFSRSGH